MNLRRSDLAAVAPGRECDDARSSLLPSSIQLLRCAAEAARPLVTRRPQCGVPAWSTGRWAQVSALVRGANRGQTRCDGSRTRPANRRCRGVVGPEGRPGDGPELFDLCVEDVVQEDLRGAGGDEETRTPDPLLAKEMLCQLSYVPVLAGEAGDGGRFWTRTRDLCLIRAVL